MRAPRISLLLAVFVLASTQVLGQSKARTATERLVVTCQNPVQPAEPIVPEVGERDAVVAGAPKLWACNASRIEWLDRLGYTYSLDRKDGMLDRVPPPAN